MDFDDQLRTESIEQAHPAEPVCVGPTTFVREVFQLMKQANTGSVLVCESDKLLGIFTERDALRLMASGAELDSPISNVMTKEPVCISVGDTVRSAISEMSIGGYRRLPIVDGSGRAVGILKVSGILRYLVEHFPDVVYNLPPKPNHHTQHREGA